MYALLPIGSEYIIETNGKYAKFRYINSYYIRTLLIFKFTFILFKTFPPVSSDVFWNTDTVNV